MCAFVSDSVLAQTPGVLLASFSITKEHKVRHRFSDKKSLFDSVLCADTDVNFDDGVNVNINNDVINDDDDDFAPWRNGESKRSFGNRYKGVTR
jgi:hypothetical protein